MRQNIQICAAALTLAVAACSRQPAMDERMKQDLEAASASTMELAPTGSGQRVVSAIEQTGYAPPKQTNSRKAVAPTKAPETPQTVHTSTEPVATRPQTRPAVSPPPPGGYKTVGEVIRNAPFPIKP